jgi:hypothetical protein
MIKQGNNYSSYDVIGFIKIFEITVRRTTSFAGFSVVTAAKKRNDN